jgi:hypothetical protein
MEIADYVRLLARRSRIIVIAAIAAGVLATAVFVFRPRMYAATATVVVPAPSASTSLIASVAQSVSDFQAALSTNVVAERVASSVGITTSEVKNGLEPSRVTDSGLVEVRFEHPSPESAEDAAFEASRQALILLLDSRLEPLEAQLAIARDGYEAAQAALLTFQERTGYLVPGDVFDQENSQMQALRDAIGTALAEGDEERVEQLQERLDEKAERFVSDSVEFGAIASAQRRADEALAAAQIAHDQAAASLESVEETENPGQGGAISSTDATGVSRFQTFLRTVVPAIVIATILAIVLVVLIEIVPARRSPIRARLKSRLPLDERSWSRSTLSRLQTLAARRQEEADRGSAAPATEAPADVGAPRTSPQASRGSDGLRSRERPKKPRLRLDPAEEALAAREARAVQEARALAAEQARTRAAEEARARAGEEARRRAAEQARALAAEEVRARAAEEARARAAEEARARAGEESKRRAAEATAKAAEEAQRKEAEARARATEEARARAGEEARARAAEVAKARAAEVAKARAAEEATAKVAEEATAKAAEEAKRKAAQETKAKAAQEAKANASAASKEASGLPSVAAGASAAGAPVNAAQARPPGQPGSAKNRRKKARAEQRSGLQPGGAPADDTSRSEAGAGSGEQEQVADPQPAAPGKDSTSAT